MTKAWRMNGSRGLECMLALAAATLFLSACGGGNGNSPQSQDVQGSASVPKTVQRAVCGAGSNPEPALQGQVPVSQRVPGRPAYSCNLELVGQSRGDGASWQHAWYTDAAGHNCSYFDTNSATANRTHLGVTVIDATNPAAPTPTQYLTSISMIDPWESLKVNDRRQVLGGVNALNGNGGPQLDLYDISGDCRHPVLISSTSVGTGTDGSGIVIPSPGIQGHEGNFSQDGLTYYGTNLTNPGYIYPMDITDLQHPKILAQWFTPIIKRTHGMSFSNDGNTGYFTLFGSGAGAAAVVAGTSGVTNGVVIADISDVQSRQANPQLNVINTILVPDGSAAQMTIPFTVAGVNGKQYLAEVDEGGSGGNSMAGWTEACKLGLPAWNMARIYDITNPMSPILVSEMLLENNDPANCNAVIPDLAGLSSFTYGSHYCSVDNRNAATTMACGYFESGIRVFDIRQPEAPKEVAYYNPTAVSVPSPGSHNNTTTAAGRPDHCSAQVHLDANAGMLYTTCQDNGFLALKFTNGAWPFPTSTTPPGLAN